MQCAYPLPGMASRPETKAPAGWGLWWHGEAAVTEEIWRQIPDHDGYEISDRGNVRGLDRVIVRSNGAPYTARACAMTVQIHRPSGLKLVRLATGRRGQSRTVYIHRIVADVFGGDP